MRKIFVIAFIFAIFLPYFAFAEKHEARVYYSEPIGAGEKVFHITICAKTRSYAPLYCNEQTKGFSEKQCLEPPKKGKPVDKEKQKVKDVPIKGCKMDDGKTIEGTSYPEVNVEKYDQTGGKCAEGNDAKADPSKSDYKYAPQFAIVDETGNITEITTAPPADIDPKITVKEYYQTTICSTYDVPAAGGNAEDITGLDPALLEEEKKTGKLTEQTLAVLKAEKFNNWPEEKCNMDNSEIDVDDSFPKSTLFDANSTFTCSIVERITGSSGSDILGKYLSGIYRWAAGIVGIVSVLVIVMNGIRISMAGGDSAAIDNAKHRIMQSIIGLVILFLSGLILYTINQTFFTGG